MKYDLNRASRISRLIAKKLSGNIPSDALEELEQWLSEDERNRQLYNRIVSEQGENDYTRWREIDWLSPLSRMHIRLVQYRKVRRRIAIFGAVSAGIAASLFISLFLFNRALQPVEISPGNTNATLVLASGEAYHLDSASSIQMTEAGVAIVKGNETSLAYNVSESDIPATEIVYHEIHVRRGGEFDLELSDGTHVFLNSESSLRYPVRFSGSERRVFLSGEAHLEVAHDAKRAFIIESGGQTVCVLGTSLNITAYSDAAEIITTLISGKVSVAIGTGEPIILFPGEQSRADVKKSTLSVTKASISPVCSIFAAAAKLSACMI